MMLLCQTFAVAGFTILAAAAPATPVPGIFDAFPCCIPHVELRLPCKPCPRSSTFTTAPFTNGTSAITSSSLATHTTSGGNLPYCSPMLELLHRPCKPLPECNVFFLTLGQPCRSIPSNSALTMDPWANFTPPTTSANPTSLPTSASLASITGLGDGLPYCDEKTPPPPNIPWPCQERPTNLASTPTSPTVVNAIFSVIGDVHDCIAGEGCPSDNTPPTFTVETIAAAAASAGEPPILMTPTLVVETPALTYLTASCTTTITTRIKEYRAPPIPKTVYLAATTETNFVDCGNCALETNTLWLLMLETPSVPTPPAATVTKSFFTTTTDICSPTIR